MTRRKLVRRSERRWTALVLVVASAVLLAAPVMLSKALVQPALELQAPAALVRHLDRHAAAGQWDSVDALFDYRWKGRSLVPDLWDAAPEAHREAFVELIRSQSRETWEKNHASAYFQNGTRLETVVYGPDLQLVRQIGLSEGRESSMDYWFERQGSRWQIISRNFTRDGTPIRTSTLVSVIRKRIAGQLGHEPDLAEFVANLPSWSGRVRPRVFTVPEQ